MKLNRLTATFGGLRGKTLAPGPGLNIIYAPNEAGKTTWCAFLRAMFYGIDTRERDTKTALADKNRWQPWSGAPMEGETALTWRGRELVLRRFARGANPFGGFSATDARTGEKAADLSGDTAGETLLGVSRGVYERSAFIGQGAIPFTGERELEKRIAALVSSGEEEVSYTQVDARLREWQRRRKYNKAGLIPRLEEELASVNAHLERMAHARARADAARVETERLEAQRQALETEQALHRRLARHELDKRCRDAFQALEDAKRQERARRTQAEALRAEAEQIADPRFPGMTPDEALQRANADARTAAEHRRAAGRTAALPGLAGLLLAAFLLILWRGGVLAHGWLALLGAVPLGIGLWLGKLRRQVADALLTRYGAAAPEDIPARAAAYREAAAAAERRSREADAALNASVIRREGAQRLLDALAENGGRPAPADDSLPAPPARTPAETDAKLASVRAELSRLAGDLAMARGELNTLGDPAALEARREELREAVARRRREYDALTLALEELAAANQELQARFSPALNARAGALMAALTGGKYDRVTLTREFQAAAGEAGSVLPRRSLSLSQGAADQLYLAVRLAVCELALPSDEPAPLVLDDALVSFDGERMALALELLRELGKTRQILLFTCHRREGESLAGRPDVTLIDLQS